MAATSAAACRLAGVSVTTALIPEAAEQTAIDRMVELRHEGRSLRAIADVIKAEGFVLSHVGVQKVLHAAKDRQQQAA